MTYVYDFVGLQQERRHVVNCRVAIVLEPEQRAAVHWLRIIHSGRLILTHVIHVFNRGVLVIEFEVFLKLVRRIVVLFVGLGR